METNPTIYITKYALTRGILTTNNYSVSPRGNYHVKNSILLPREVYYTMGSAQERATLMKDQEIVRLEKKFNKLKMMNKFDASEI